MEKKPPLLPHSLSPRSNAEATKFYYGAHTDQIIACAIAVHKELGPGFRESIYEESFAIELGCRKIPFERQVLVRIHYRGVVVGFHRVDLIIDKKVVVELKAVKEIDDAHLATCLSYLKATQLRVGLIINFSEARTRIRRVMRAPEWTTETGSEGEAEGFIENCPRRTRFEGF